MWCYFYCQKVMGAINYYGIRGYEGKGEGAWQETNVPLSPSPRGGGCFLYEELKFFLDLIREVNPSLPQCPPQISIENVTLFSEGFNWIRAWN